MDTLATLAELKTYLGLTAPNAQQTMVLEVARLGAQKTIDNFLGMSLVQATHTEYLPAANNLRVRTELIDAYESTGGKILPVERYVTERRLLQLGRAPVRSVTSVYEYPDAWLTAGGSWPASSLLVEGDDYYLDVQRAGFSLTGFLVRTVGPWTVQARSVKVTYVAGFEAAEIAADFPDVRAAYFDLVQNDYNTAMMHMMNAANKGGTGIIVQEHIASWGVQYDAATNAQLYGKAGRMPLSVARRLEPYVNYGVFL